MAPLIHQDVVWIEVGMNHLAAHFNESVVDDVVEIIEACSNQVPGFIAIGMLR